MSGSAKRDVRRIAEGREPRRDELGRAISWALYALRHGLTFTAPKPTVPPTLRA